MRDALGLSRVISGRVGGEIVAQMRENLVMFAEGPLDAELHRRADDAVPPPADRILMPSQRSRRMAEVKPRGTPQR